MVKLNSPLLLFSINPNALFVSPLDPLSSLLSTLRNNTLILRANTIITGANIILSILPVFFAISPTKSPMDHSFSLNTSNSIMNGEAMIYNRIYPTLIISTIATNTNGMNSAIATSALTTKLKKVIRSELLSA